MVRRIAKCRSCLKRFCTASGQSLCPLCRPKVKAGVQQNVIAPTVDHDIQEKKNEAVAHNTDQFCGQKRKNEAPTEVDAVRMTCNDMSNPDDRDDEVEITDIALTTDHDDTLPKKQKTDADTTLATSSLKINTTSLGEEDHHDNLRCCITNDSNTINAQDELELDADSSGDLLKQDLLMENDSQIEEEEDSCCGSENNDNLLECIEIDDSDSEEEEENHDEEEEASDKEVQQPQVGQSRKTENDVCYICGSNLAGKGLNSRVAHMKRCSTKYGKQTMVGSDEVDTMKSDESSTNWHGKDADKNSADHGKEKQSVLRQFFKAPVRSLTNVLMAGSLQASKKKPDTVSGKKKQSHRRGFWASNNRSRDGQCPSYKRIPGTDFITDGFYYAGSLTQNYFLTHFHSDHYGGITKKWNEGIIYCSVSVSFVSCLD